jgi:broad specificity phosphatase PhoE
MLYIIRHGQTSKNKKAQLQGRSNEPLNEDGIRQSEKAAEIFKEKNISFERVYSSPLVRAIETGRISAGTDDITIDDRLIEMDYGPYEGMDLTDPAPEVMAFFMDFAGTPAPDGMEQLHEVIRRTGEFADEIMDEAKKGNVLISTHAIALKGILEHLTPGSNGYYWDKNIGNCDVFVVDVDADGYGIPRPLV